jgi:Family of unknown function (DUF6188)
VRAVTRGYFWGGRPLMGNPPVVPQTDSKGFNCERYGLPKDLDLTFLKDAILIQVCFGRNEVILRFDREISITIESTFRVQDSDGIESFFDTSLPAAKSLVSLISDAVVGVGGDCNRSLLLKFSSGSSLEVYDSSQEFESYQIQVGEDIYVR